MKEKRQIPMLGRERTDWQARLNAAKQVNLANRGQDELSWVLYDKNDPAHENIPSVISNSRQLPFGAVVMSVDMTPTSAEEAQLIRKHNERHGDNLPTPPQNHAIYFTAHEDIIKPLATTFHRSFDRRTHMKEPMTRENQTYGHMVRWDVPPAGDEVEHYHMQIPGNNHPKSPVEGLRRIALSSSLPRIMERLALEGPSSLPGYHEFPDRAMLNGKHGIMSMHLASELGQQISERIQGRAGVREENFSERFAWPVDNKIAERIARVAKSDAEMQERADRDRAIYERVTPTARDASGAIAELGIKPNSYDIAKK